jgi:broad specificity phosphatase PhoE
VLYLVRHGRTAANKEGRLQGRLDPPLDDVGRAQAAAIATLIGDVDDVISSSLARAQETAAFFGCEVTTDDRWIEVAYGEYEGVRTSDVPSEVWQMWRTNSTFAPAGGESFGLVDARVRAACEDLVDRIGQRDIVVVSHVSPIKAAVAWSLRATMDIMFYCHLSQASVCRIDKGAFGPLLRTFNEQAGEPIARSRPGSGSPHSTI